MRKNQIKLGDIILIPVDGDKCALGKIIYLSRRYRNVILLNIYPLVVSLSEKMPDLPMGIFNEMLIYTGNHKIKTEEWKKINNVLVTDEEKKMSERIVGGEVWIEDEYIRAATEHDFKTLKSMLVDGTKLVEKKLNDYLTNISRSTILVE
jgi:hypothetical protein